MSDTERTAKEFFGYTAYIAWWLGRLLAVPLIVIVAIPWIWIGPIQGLAALGGALLGLLVDILLVTYWGWNA